jgi:hypothetical protein
VNLENYQDVNTDYIKDQQKIFRESVRSLLAISGITKAVDNPEKINEAGILENAYKEISSGTHSWDGRIEFKESVKHDLVGFAQAMAEKRTSVTPGQFDAWRVALHEELHGLSSMGPHAYVGIGVLVEEVTTEIVARKIMRENYGKLKGNVIDPGLGSVSEKYEDDYKYRPSTHGAYGMYIPTITSQLRKIFYEQDKSKAATMSADDLYALYNNRANDMIERVCLNFKKEKREHAKTEDEHLDALIRHFDELTSSERESLRTYIKGAFDKDTN